MAVKTWGDFEIDFERLLGRGGMGAVYMGRQISLDRPAAIKVLKVDLTSSPEFVKRFNREAALLARIVDNHVVQIFGAGEAEGHHYYAMEYVQGEDYAGKIKKGHKFTMDEVLKVGESVGIALQMAWRHRIIHRDIKPSNILLTKDNETKVMDFGLAKDPESDLTASEVIMGTAKYMSPEQATGGACDIRSDLYSLGVVLYELASGQPPFTGEGATAIMYQHVHKQPTSPRTINPQIPVDIEKLILRLMEKDPERRYATPEALVGAIHKIQDGVTPEEHQTLYDQTIKVEDKRPKTQVGGGPATVTPATGTGVQPAPNSNAKIIGAIAAVVIIGLIAFIATRGEKPTEPPKGGNGSTGGTITKGPPKGGPDNPPPPPPPPPPETKKEPAKAPWIDAKERAELAFKTKQWASAGSLFEEAIAKAEKEPDIIPDLTQKMNQAKANEQIEMGDKAYSDQNEARALTHYEAAYRFKEDPNTKKLVNKLTYSYHSKEAEKYEGKDWQKAAGELRKALEGAAEGDAEETRARLKYCSTFSDAEGAMLRKDWGKALEHWQELANNPRAQAPAIEAGMKRASEEIANIKAMARETARKEFELIVTTGQELRRQAKWAEAKAKLEESAAEKYKEFPRAEIAVAMDEIALALKAPPGMIYIPGGKFQMGGGRAVESPVGEATVVPLYMDEHEVRVSDYVEFMKALDAFGHTKDCLKAEPPNKKHGPLDWDTQKPEDPVVGIDWWDAGSFANWKKKRLPTEAEWEHAAGFDPKESRRLYPWGAKYVKEQGKSYLGLDGMSSSVLEWTADWFNKYPWSPATHSDFGEKRRVVRGGVLLAEYATEATMVTYRYWYMPVYRSRKLGFRCVQDLPEK